MKQLDRFTTWVDARHAASAASMDAGFAWIMHVGRYGWLVVPGESLDDAPRSHVFEYAGGVEQ